MNILDHRILIPKSARLVWELVSDLSQNPTWQVDHSSISFLTTRHDGVGVRWRYSTPSGKEFVAETVAWYDGLGYEYTFIDGVSYRENKGRIRLQEIAEGTVVQWTFSYEMGGLLGGVRSTLVVKRQIENVMIDSLKTLWRVLNQAKADRDGEVKSLMRDAPDYEARAQYKPRHPSVAKAENHLEPEAEPIVIPEPAYSDDDTRPRPAVQVDESAFESVPEPTSEAKVKVEETVMPVVEAKAVDEASARETVEATPVPLEDMLDVDDQPSYEPPRETVKTFPALSDATELPELITPPSVLPERPVITEISEIDAKQVRPDEMETQEQTLITDASMEQAGFSTSTQEAAKARPDFLDTARTDTSEISVFDVFGLPKPSETQEMKAVTLPETVFEVTSVPQVKPYSGRKGLRIVLRRKRVKLRRPE